MTTAIIVRVDGTRAQHTWARNKKLFLLYLFILQFNFRIIFSDSKTKIIAIFIIESSLLET